MNDKPCSLCKIKPRHQPYVMWCIECGNKKNKGYREKNTPARLLSYAKSRAKLRGLSCTLQLEDVAIPEICPILGIIIDVTLTGKAKPNSPSIHRIDSKKGYTKDNCIVISWRANDLLCDASIDELEKLIKWLQTRNCQNGGSRSAFYSKPFK